MLGDLAARPQRQERRLVVVREVGQVRDGLAATGKPAAHLEYFPAVQQAVDSVRAAPATGDTSTAQPASAARLPPAAAGS